MIAFSDPFDSPFRRLDPRIKLLWSVCVSIIATRLTSLPAMAIFFVVAMLPVWVMSKGVIRFLLASLKLSGLLLFLAVFQLLTAWMNGKGFLTDETFRQTGTIVFRFYLVIMSAMVLFQAMDFAEFSAAIRSAKSSRAPRRWNIAIEVAAFTLGSAFQMVPILFEEMKTVVMVQRARGVGVTEGTKLQQVRKLLRMGMPFFFRVMEVARQGAIALKTSGYQVAAPRSQHRVLTLSAIDRLVLVLILTVGGAALLFPFIV